MAILEKSNYSGYPGVSLCFPCYNEEGTIGEVLLDAYNMAKNAHLNFEIIVCDDASNDRSAEIIDQVAEKIPDLKILRHETNQGIFTTYEHLYAVCEKEFVFLNSTDQQYRNTVLLDMIPLTEQWDMIIARRKSKNYPPVRALISWAYNFLPVLLFGVQVYDAGAVKLVRNEIIRKYTIISRSPFSEAERIIRASRDGYRGTGFPVDVTPRKTGSSSGSNRQILIQSLMDVCRVWWDIQIRK